MHGRRRYDVGFIFTPRHAAILSSDARDAPFLRKTTNFRIYLRLFQDYPHWEKQMALALQRISCKDHKDKPVLSIRGPASGRKHNTSLRRDVRSRIRRHVLQYSSRPLQTESAMCSILRCISVILLLPFSIHALPASSSPSPLVHMHLRAYYKADRQLDVTATVFQSGLVTQNSVLPTVLPSPPPPTNRLPLAPYKAVAAGWYRPIAARRQARGLINPFNAGRPPRVNALHNADSYTGNPDTPKAKNDTGLPALAGPASRTFSLMAGWYRPHVTFKDFKRDLHIFSIQPKRSHIVLELLLRSALGKDSVQAINATARVAKGSVGDSNYHPAAKAGLVEGWCMCS